MSRNQYNNTLIAEFVGYEKITNGQFKDENGYWINLVKFQTYDYIMPVVEFINNIESLHFIVIEGKRVQWIVEDDSTIPIIYTEGTMLENIYKAVLDYIIWYNKNLL